MTYNPIFDKQKCLLLSIRPAFANKIFDGTKTVELRRSFPQGLEHHTVVIYVSSPVKAIWGGFQISQVLTASPSDLWSIVKPDAGITQQQFDQYYLGSEIGHAIFISNAWKVREPIALNRLRDSLNPFTPPQSYRYLLNDHLERLRALGFESRDLTEKCLEGTPTKSVQRSIQFSNI